MGLSLLLFLPFLLISGCDSASTKPPPERNPAATTQDFYQKIKEIEAQKVPQKLKKDEAREEK